MVDSDFDTVFHLERALRALPEGPYLRGSGERLLHPGALFASSLTKVLQRIQTVTESFALRLSHDDVMNDWPRISGAIEAMLLALESHHDNLETILDAISTSENKRLTLELRKQLAALFKELVRRPVNQLKHGAHTVRPYSYFNSTFCLHGYFVCGLRDDGSIGPTVRAHGTSGSGWSLNATVRRVLAILIRSAQTIFHVLPTPHPKRQLGGVPTAYAKTLRSICDWLAANPPFCFPNEVRIPMPSVAVENDLPIVRLQTLKRLRDVQTQGVRVAVSYTADGHHRSYKLPST